MKCPHCEKSIQDTAKKCKYCKKSISITNGEKFDKFLIKNKKYLITVIILIIVWGIWSLLYYKPYIEYCWHRPLKISSSDFANSIFNYTFQGWDCPCYWMNIFSDEYQKCKENEKQQKEREKDYLKQRKK